MLQVGFGMLSRKSRTSSSNQGSLTHTLESHETCQTWQVLRNLHGQSPTLHQWSSHFCPSRTQVYNHMAGTASIFITSGFWTMTCKPWLAGSLANSNLTNGDLCLDASNVTCTYMYLICVISTVILRIQYMVGNGRSRPVLGLGLVGCWDSSGVSTWICLNMGYPPFQWTNGCSSCSHILDKKNAQHWPIQLVLFGFAGRYPRRFGFAQASQAFSQSGRYMTLVTWAMKSPEEVPGIYSSSKML